MGKEYESLKALSAKHEEIFRMRAMGMKICDVARELGMNTTSVTGILKCPLGVARMAQLQEGITERFVESRARVGTGRLTAREVLSDASVKAAQELVHMVDDSQSERVKQISCLEILDRTGVYADKKADTQINVIVSETQVANANRAMDAAKAGLSEKPSENRTIAGKSLICPDVSKTSVPPDLKEMTSPGANDGVITNITP